MKYHLYLIVFLFLALIGCRKSQHSQNTMSAILSPDSLHYINEFIGEKPMAVDLWNTEPLQSELKKILGNQFDSFLQDVASAQELKRDQVIYTIAALSDSLTEIKGYTVALFDTAINKVEVFFLKNKEARNFQSEGEGLYIPDEVRNLMYQYLNWNVYEGILPCADCEGIKTELALEPIQNQTDGRYFLQQTYLYTDNAVKTFQWEGVYSIQHESAQISSDTVYQIKRNQPVDMLYFSKMAESNLEFLDNNPRGKKSDGPLILEKKKLPPSPPQERNSGSLFY